MILEMRGIDSQVKQPELEVDSWILNSLWNLQELKAMWLANVSPRYLPMMEAEAKHLVQISITVVGCHRIPLKHWRN